MKILIIDDERAIRNSLKEILMDEGYEADVAEDGAQGVDMALKEKYSVIFCDIKMPNMDGIEVLDKFMEEGVDAAVIMISGHGDIDTAVECIKKGAFDFIQKPLDLNRILITIKNATDKVTLISKTERLASETSRLKKKVYGQEMVGESAPIQKVRDMIDKVAPTDARVLITGANGTGKELVARTLHQKSMRSQMPYVEVNCAAIPSELIESELQAKVLRVLQERKLSRVGSDKDISVDVRVLAATNKNLKEEIAKGNFREDLYHRLSVIVINVPSLDERKDDIPILVNHFIDQICTETGMQRREVDADAMQLLVDKTWTGNIRELRNVVERLLILSGSRITAQDIHAYVY